MDTACRSHFRIVFVSTRDPTQHNGRPQTLSHIVRALSRRHRVDIFRLRSVMETRNLVDFAGALLNWAKSLLAGKPLPLQCVLYAAPRECEAIALQIAQMDCDAVYLDMVRCQTLLTHMRRLMPNQYIVTDFDDLLSRRATTLSKGHLPFLAGHVGKHFPGWVRRLIEGPLARLITAYEAATLPAAEEAVVAGSNAISLVSSAESAILTKRLTPWSARSIVTIPPPAPLQAMPWQETAALRFVFIGSDGLLQNRMAIDFLLKTWATLRPATPLHIYGRQTRAAVPVADVHWHGFVDSLAEVYVPGSIALAPALLLGGVKTKVVEAWAWGCPVLGNSAAFEGYAVPYYPLVAPESEWAPFLTEPMAYADLWVRAARIGHAFARDTLSQEQFDRAWEDLLCPLASDGVAVDGPAAARVSHLRLVPTPEVPHFARSWSGSSAVQGPRSLESKH